MFQSSPIPSDRNNPDLSISQLRDGLASITHRVGELQALLSRKMDRSECLGICQKKASHGQLKRALEDLQGRLRQQKSQEVERNMKMQEIAIDKINQLGKKLKTTQKIQKNEGKGKQNKAGKDSLKRIIQPQQLFIESNETMFSLLIEEIYKLQSKDEDFERQLELRNKKIIALNNEVCSKLEKLETEIDEKYVFMYDRVKFRESLRDSKVIGNTWSHIQGTNNKATVHKCSGGQSGQFQTFRWEMLSKNIQTLQKELLGKMNIKDLLPVIRQNCQPLTESLHELREYVEQSMESTKRILSSQTEINKEISLGVKVAWWHSCQQQHHFAIINKEIINLIPEILQVGKGNPPNFVKVLQQGIYLLKIHPIYNSGQPSLEEDEEGEENEEQAFEVMIDTDVVLCGRQSALRLDKNSEVRVIQRVNKELLLCLQKL